MADLMRKIEFLSQLAVYKYTRKAKTWVMSAIPPQPSLPRGREGEKPLDSLRRHL